MTDYRRNTIKLPKGSRSLSGEIIAGRYGSDMLDDLFKWLSNMEPDSLISVQELRNEILIIEKEYGVDRVE